MAQYLGFRGDGISFLGSLWPVILLVPIFGSIQGPHWQHEHLSIKMISSVRVSGRLVFPPSFQPLPDSSGRPQLVSSMLVIKISLL